MIIHAVMAAARSRDGLLRPTTSTSTLAAASACGAPQSAVVELDDVDALYTENGLWPAVFGPDT